jgi:hypothetical protein
LVGALLYLPTWAPLMAAYFRLGVIYKELSLSLARQHAPPSHRYLMSRLSLQVFYLWRHVLSTQRRHLYYGGQIYKYYLPPSTAVLPSYTRAALSSNSNGTRSVYNRKTQKAVYIVICLWAWPSQIKNECAKGWGGGMLMGTELPIIYRERKLLYTCVLAKKKQCCQGADISAAKHWRGRKKSGGVGKIRAPDPGYIKKGLKGSELFCQKLHCTALNLSTGLLGSFHLPVWIARTANRWKNNTDFASDWLVDLVDNF